MANEKINELLKDKDFAKELGTTASAEEAQKLFASKGVDLTIDELNNLRDGKAELSLEELDLVAGGSGGSDAANEVKDFFKTLFSGW